MAAPPVSCATAEPPIELKLMYRSPSGSLHVIWMTFWMGSEVKDSAAFFHVMVMSVSSFKEPVGGVTVTVFPSGSYWKAGLEKEMVKALSLPSSRLTAPVSPDFRSMYCMV